MLIAEPLSISLLFEFWVPKSSLARQQCGSRSWDNMKHDQHIIYNKPCHHIRSVSCFEKQRFQLMDYLI